MKYFLILNAVLIHSFALAQNNFIPGTIETNDGQIIEGKIKFRDNSLTPDNIEFLNLNTGISQKYAPFQLVAFEVNGMRYVSKGVDIDVTPKGLHKQDYINSRKIVKDTLFLALQVKSALSLLFHKDKEFGERLFIQIEQGQIIELIKHEYYEDILIASYGNYAKRLVTNYKYKNQLSFYFKSCPSVVKKLDMSALKLNIIKKLVVEYNNCSGSIIDYQQEEEKIKIQYGIVAGLASQTLLFKSGADLFEELVAMDIQPSVNPIFGGSIDIIFPMNQRKWSLNNLLLFIPFDYQASLFVPTFVSEAYDNVDYNISGSYIKLLTKMRYCFSSKQLKPFINIGISTAYLVEFQNEMKREIYTYGSVRYHEASAISTYKKTEIGLEMGAGLKIGNHLSAELVYEVSNGMSKYIDLVSNFQRTYLILNYSF